MLVNLGDAGFNVLIEKVLASQVEGHCVSLIVDQDANVVLLQCLPDLLIRFFCVLLIVEEKDKRSHVMLLLNN